MPTRRPSATRTDVSDDAAPDVKIVPENVSNIAKSDAGVPLDEGYQEKIIAVTKPENLRAVFADNGITGDDADEIIAALSQLVDVSRLRPGQKVRIAFATDAALLAADQANLDADPTADPAAAAAAKKLLRPIRVSIYDDGAHQATVARADNNQFVRADEPSATPELYAEAPQPEETPAGGPPTLYDAVYETALDQQMPKPLIDELIRVFAYDVDLQSRIGTGDTLEVFHSLPEPDAEGARDSGDILYASLTLGGVAKRYYRFRTPDDGIVDYYDEDGKSAKKFLVRKPITAGRITSSFGWRVHPILGYRRLHAGVDYGAPRGTPILAAGNGVIEKAGPSSRLRQPHHHPPPERLRDRLRPPVGASPRASSPASRCTRARSSATSARPAFRPDRTSTSRSASTASRSIRCASACRAAACSRATTSPPSRRSAQRIDDLLGNGGVVDAADDACEPRPGRRPVENAGTYAALPPFLPPSTRGRNRSLSVPPVIRTRAPSGTSPASILSASGSCTSRWMTRFSGRAP